MRLPSDPRIAIFGLFGVFVVAATAAYKQTSLNSPGVNAHNSAPDPRQAMIAALGAEGPHPSLAGAARTFDRFVGTWDADYTFHLDNGRVSTKKGDIKFGWVLDGRAVQDIWTTYATESGKERSSGTSFRFVDPKSGKWRVVFINPQYGYVVNVEGGQEGDRIVLRGTDVDGSPIRWTFFDITDNSFGWHGEKSHDGGKTWKLEEDHRMRRSSGASGE